MESVVWRGGLKIHRDKVCIVHWEMGDNWEREYTSDRRVICIYNYFNPRQMKIYWANLVIKLSLDVVNTNIYPNKFKKC